MNQKTIEADTRVDILYDTADRYGLIFQTEDSYITRQYVNKGYTVTFTKTDENGHSSMTVTDSGGTDISSDSDYLIYENPTRQGYTFAGWKYEVHSDVTGADVTVENGKYYKTVGAGTQWDITEDMVEEAVVIKDSDSGEAKMIYLYPVWTPDMANVRVVYWTKDLGGGAKDVQVTVTKDESNGQADYLQNLDESYRNSKPTTVGGSFSNVGSFTFMAPTNSKLDLSMSGGQFATVVTDSFETTGESTKHEGTLKKLIDDNVAQVLHVREVAFRDGDGGLFNLAGPQGDDPLTPGGQGKHADPVKEAAQGQHVRRPCPFTVRIPSRVVAVIFNRWATAISFFTLSVTAWPHTTSTRERRSRSRLMSMLLLCSSGTASLRNRGRYSVGQIGEKPAS